MSTTTASRAAKHAPSLDIRAEIRDLEAALPIVIFAKAIHEALRRPQPARATLKRAVAR